MSPFVDVSSGEVITEVELPLVDFDLTPVESQVCSEYYYFSGTGKKARDRRRRLRLLDSARS